MGGYRPRSFDCEAGSLPTMTTFTEAPLQSRKVEFLDSGFRLGFPREAFPRRAKLKCSLAFTPTHSGLPLDSSLKDMAPPAFAVDHTILGPTALKCIDPPPSD